MDTVQSLMPIDAGGGRITVRRYHGSDVFFSELSATYPLKLLSPRVAQDGLAVAYILSYGGGLVGGDNIKLAVDVGPGSSLLLLSQGSTKVFKARFGERAARPRGSRNLITQNIMDVVVSDKSALFLLPHPVTCFRSASYNQMQTFHISGNASAVLLDWVTSGRRSLGEEWVFSRYYSVNEVWVDGKRVARDVLLLQDQQVGMETLSPHPLIDKLAPYSCYATLILYGPMVQNIIRDISIHYEAISVFTANAPADLIWSLSRFSEVGCIVRVAGNETESVRGWLAGALHALEDVVGVDVYRKAFT